MSPAHRIALALVLAASLVPSIGAAQAPLVSGFGGPLDFGADVLARDDSISVAVDLAPAFPVGIDYFGTRYTQLFVNTNGSLSFGGTVGTLTPDPFPQSSLPLIAAWWADVDTRELILGEPDRNLVYYALEPDRLVATWIDVGYYDHHVDLLNAFQIILTAAPAEPAGTFDVELRYNRCEWTTGDATPGHMMGLGGIAAQAGFDAGDLVNYLTLPGSLTNAVLDLCTTSNVAMPGVWQLHPRGGAIVGTCGNGLRETGEACDDGNLVPHDGCDEMCAIDVACYDPTIDAGTDVDADLDGTIADGGLPPCFVVEEDASVPIDAAVPMDAFVPRDASTPRDAAVRRDSGGTPFPDVGRFDAGRRVDAGPPPNLLLVTGTGCSCGIAGGEHGMLASLGLLALVAVRRRRR